MANIMSNEALAVLGLDTSPAGGVDVRRAYVRQALAVRVDADPERFTRLRDAYDVLAPKDGGDPDQVTVARDQLWMHPDSAEARWTLLSYLPYDGRADAGSLLLEGARRSPEEFLDELMFHFPQEVPPELQDSGENTAGAGRLLLSAGVHAVQGRPAESLRALRTALEKTNLNVPALVRLALTPVFSLHERGHSEAAAEALAMLKNHLDASSWDALSADWKTATMLKVAQDLDRLGPTFPLELRQAAARGAKAPNFDNTPADARFATARMKAREVRKLSQQLKQEAPTLSEIFRLDMVIPAPSLRPALSWVAIAVAVLAILRLAVLVYRMVHDSDDTDKLLKSVTDQLINEQFNDIQNACSTPDSDRCREYQKLFKVPPTEGIPPPVDSNSSGKRP